MVSPSVHQESVQRTYEMICDHSRALVGEIDSRRWLVGDDACEVETRYGEHTMQAFARDIGMNKSTVAGWKRVAAFYPNSIRRNLLDAFPNLTYTYFKDALRWNDLDYAVHWLERCSAEGWSADQAAHQLTNEIEGGDDKKEDTSIQGRVENILVRDGMCIVEISIPMDYESALIQGDLLKIKVKD